MLFKKLITIILLFILFITYIPTPVHAVTPTLESFSATGTIAGNGTTLSISLPTGVASGDLLVACVAAAGDDISNISASGWTHAITAGGGGTSPKIGMLYRFWQPGDNNPAVFTISTSNNLSVRRGNMWRISGADATPSDATPSFNVSSSSTSRIYNGITTDTNDALLLGCLNWSSNDSVYTPDADLSNTATQNRHAADSGVQTTAGATGSFTGSGNASPYVSILWAVAPGTSPVNNAPTIALNSPSNAATNVSTTTTFTFTGSDDDSDDLTYEIQISDNPNDFVGGAVLADNFSGGGGGSFHPQPHATATTWQGDIQVDDRMCQSFTAVGGKWAKTVFPLGDSRVDTSGTAYARIYTHNGVFGTSSSPANAGDPADQTTNGTPTIDWLAESDGVVLGASFASGDFDFSASGANQIRFTAGANYVVCGDWIPNNNLENNTWAWSGDVLNSGTLHNGNLYHDGFSSFNHGVHADWDLHFDIYESFTLEAASSPSDAGFANIVNGGDTNPFTAGEQISYSAQATLDEGITYYWRVRVNDGTVSSSWTSTRSFTTSASPTPTPTATSTPTPTPASTASPTPTSQISSANTTTSSTSQTCSDAQPTGTPILFQITTTDDTAEVFFTPLLNVDTYYISYATNTSAEEHGLKVKLGSEGVQSYTVGYLQPGTTYYFKVRGQNGCAPGEWSSIKAAATTGSIQNVFQNIALNIISPNKEILEVKEVTIGEPQKCTHTVSSGDTLWSIAEEVYGSGFLYEEIITNNKEKYPNIESNLTIGWELSFPCKSSNPEAQNSEETQIPNTHDVLIKVEHEGKPLAFADVELHSDPKYGKTDENGEVLFSNVEKGEHTLKIAFQDYNAEQKLIVEGEKRDFNVSVHVELRKNSLPVWGIGIIALLVTTIIVLFIIIFKRRV